MSRHMIRSLVGATALALVAGAAVVPASAASAASSATSAASSATAWKLSYRFSTGTVDYTLRGRIQGVPGNAHSGQIWFDISDDEDEGILLDWNCPAGVVPPTYYGGPNDPANPPTTCVNLRGIYADSGHALPYTDWSMTKAHEVGHHALLDNVTGVYLGCSVWSNYVLHGVGPVTTSTAISSDPVTGDPVSKAVYKVRATRATGHFGWISFDDPRLKASSRITGEWDYDPA